MTTRFFAALSMTNEGLKMTICEMVRMTSKEFGDERITVS
jgi:hypothetical protein